MANVVIIGLQWGDEGKGKIVDLLCPAFDVVARFQGGHNAGHTVKFGDRHFALHLVPSGILHPGVSCVLGNGMVVAPASLFEELEGLAAAGVETAGRLWVSDRAQILLPPHARLDQAREAARGDRSIGTTARGIGPAYEGKAGRVGLRACELAAADLEARLGDLLASLGEAEAADRARSLAAECRAWGERLAPLLADVGLLLGRWMAAGRSVLFEGAQGTLLDVDFGTYPFVTSSNTTAGAACTGTGVPPTALDGVIGVLKAYSTRVGGGPFPTELAGEAGERLRRRGNEFGTTTGRPRRCGWFDAVAASYAARLNGVDALALTKLDVLDELEEIPVCVAYRVGGRVMNDFPPDVESAAAAEPVFERLPGWMRPTVGMVDFAALPAAARGYVRFLEERIGAPVALVSTGPRREETILRAGDRLDRLTAGRLGEVAAARGSEGCSP